MIKILEKTQNELINKLVEDLNLISENKIILTEFVQLIIEIEKLKNKFNLDYNVLKVSDYL